MPVIRVQKTKNYTVMANYHLRDKRLSFKAKGLMSFMLSLPEEWDYTVNGLSAFATDGRDGVREALRELETAGYLRMGQSRTSGKFGKTEYIITEKPFTGNPLTGKPITAKPITENPTQLSTKEVSTKKENKEVVSTSHDDGLSECVKFWQDNMLRDMTPFEFQTMESLIEDYSLEWLKEALKKAALLEPSKRNMKYITGILKGWKQDGGLRPWELQHKHVDVLSPGASEGRWIM